jgi:hypothetical protein
MGNVSIGLPTLQPVKRSAPSWKWLFAVLLIGVGMAYLRDPPWLAQVTSGFGSWEQDRAGMRFRWMGGRASFFVPADAARVQIPLQAFAAGPSGDPFVIDVRVDGKRASQIVLDHTGWVNAEVSVPQGLTRRRFRRIDLRSNRTWSERSLSVQVGEVALK